MKKTKREGLERAGYKITDTQKFLNLSDEEIAKLLEKNTANAVNTSTNSAETNSVVIIDMDAVANEFAKGDIVYRVQLGAYKNRISKGVFRNAGTILELKTDDDVYRYATKGLKTIEGADLVLEGYGDAFITAYKDGKRIPMSATKATMETQEKEDITKIESFSSVDKSLVSFKVQLGALRKVGTNDMEEKTKDLQGVEKQGTGSGMIRYTAGSFSDYSKADKYRQELADKGLVEAFVIAVFKGEIISIQEAQELLK